MSKQWEGYAARQAQRKRARPVIATQPTVQIFTNVRDAAKEDSDDEGHHSHNESDGADDEFDNDQEGAEREEDQSDGEERGRSASSSKVPRTTTMNEDNLASSAPNSMADALVRSLSHTSNENVSPNPPPEPFTQDLDLLNLRPDSAMYDLSNFASDSDFPSFPSSPMFGSQSRTLPRMSEGESSGTDKSSYFRGLLNGLFLFRNGEFSQLQYPLYVYFTFS